MINSHNADPQISLSPAATRSPLAHPKLLSNGYKVLIADDEPEVVKAIAMRLKFTGYEVVAAYDGLSTTQIAINEKPDVILLDIGMPCGDGLTVAKRLADNVNTGAIPIIFLTARTAISDRQRASQLGASDYITKPYTADRLFWAIERALKGHEDSGGAELGF